MIENDGGIVGVQPLQNKTDHLQNTCKRKNLGGRTLTLPSRECRERGGAENSDGYWKRQGNLGWHNNDTNSSHIDVSSAKKMDIIASLILMMSVIPTIKFSFWETLIRHKMVAQYTTIKTTLHKKQECQAVADKPARRESMPKIAQVRRENKLQFHRFLVQSDFVHFLDIKQIPLSIHSAGAALSIVRANPFVPPPTGRATRSVDSCAKELSLNSTEWFNDSANSRNIDTACQVYYCAKRWYPHVPVHGWGLYHVLVQCVLFPQRSYSFCSDPSKKSSAEYWIVAETNRTEHSAKSLSRTELNLSSVEHPTVNGQCSS